MKTLLAWRSRLKLESLEQRTVPTSISFPDAYGVITVVGSNAKDTVQVTYDASGTNVKVSLAGIGSLTTSAASVKKIMFYGYGGNDWFSNTTSEKVTAYGGLGNDTLIGGSGKNVLYGGGDNDVLIGGSEDDSLFGEGGTDVLYGLAGDDYLDGGNDGLVDSLWGGYDDDTFITHFSQDTVKDATWEDWILPF